MSRRSFWCSRFLLFWKSEGNTRLHLGLTLELKCGGKFEHSVDRNYPVNPKVSSTSTVIGKSHFVWEVSECPLTSIWRSALWLSFACHGEPRTGHQQEEIKINFIISTEIHIEKKEEHKSSFQPLVSFFLLAPIVSTLPWVEISCSYARRYDKCLLSIISLSQHLYFMK